MRPIKGLTAADTTKPNEKAPAVMPRSHPNSEMIGGKNSENAVRALTPIAMVTNVTATMSQPQKKGSRISLGIASFATVQVPDGSIRAHSGRRRRQRVALM